MHNKPPLLSHFRFAHLAHPPARDISRAYAELALLLSERLPDGPEGTVALRKLLESKDAAVRAMLPLPGTSLEMEIADAREDDRRRETAITVETPPVKPLP